MHKHERLRKVLAHIPKPFFPRNTSGDFRMRDNNTRKQPQVKDTEHIMTVLLVLTLAAVSFAGGYYVAAMQAALMVTK
jgi:hypothetical protein